MKLILTPRLAYSCGIDAGNRSMRQGSRTKWNRDDYQVAAQVTNKMLDQCYAEEKERHATAKP